MLCTAPPLYDEPVRTTLVLLVLLIAGCTINHRSDELACTKQSDCTGGRVCMDNFCVMAGGIDASGCPAPCTSCNVAQKQCTIDCNANNCKNALVCPSGFDCSFLCDVESACSNGVDCTFGRSCAFACSGRSSCRGITCGPGKCTVNCTGEQACRDITCGPSCACDVTCSGTTTCTQGGILCTNGCTSGRGCTSAPGLCHHACPLGVF